MPELHDENQSKPPEDEETRNSEATKSSRKHTKHTSSKPNFQPPKLRVGSMVPPSSFAFQVPPLDLDNHTADRTERGIPRRMYESLRDENLHYNRSRMISFRDESAGSRIQISESILDRFQAFSSESKQNHDIFEPTMEPVEEEKNSGGDDTFDFRM